MCKSALFGILTVCMAVTGYGQIKYEREFRIKEMEVPAGAIDFIHALPFEINTKWYKEISLDGVTVEAKFKVDNHSYSIEFDTLGNLQDIEIGKDWMELPSATRENITAHLEPLFSRYRIEKTQEQLTGEKDALIALMRDKVSSHAYTTRYEVEVRARVAREYIAYEILYDKEGNMIRKSEIVTRDTDNLEY